MAEVAVRLWEDAFASTVVALAVALGLSGGGWEAGGTRALYTRDTVFRLGWECSSMNLDGTFARSKRVSPLSIFRAFPGSIEG